jgi:GTP cyclohydrolase IB
LPIKIETAGTEQVVHAMVNAEVNLPNSSVKSIHMSRLYLLLVAFANSDNLNQNTLLDLLHDMVQSHRDSGTTNAKVSIDFHILQKRPALLSPNLSGWQSYPVRLEASLMNGHFTFCIQASVVYSSTCPCSAALSRQLVSDAFLNHFHKQDAVTPEEVSVWLNEHASIATPHSQRSLAHVTVQPSKSTTELGLTQLIFKIEDSLKTPVQTAVKRIDEQAFARLNGANLMYVEDAARRIHHALASSYTVVQVQVRHLESLHSHDAVAQI